MSAFEDISAAIAKAPPVRRGFTRMIFVGRSAKLSLNATAAQGLHGYKPFKLDVVDSTEFDGWALRDFDHRRGSYYEVELPPHEQADAG